MPASVNEKLPEKPWMRADYESGSFCEAPETITGPLAIEQEDTGFCNKKTEVPEDFAQGPENNDKRTGNYQQKVRQSLPPNSSLNSSLNSPIERSTALNTFSCKTEEKRGKQTDKSEGKFMAGTSKENQDTQLREINRRLNGKTDSGAKERKEL